MISKPEIEAYAEEFAWQIVRDLIHDDLSPDDFDAVLKRVAERAVEIGQSLELAEELLSREVT